MSQVEACSRFRLGDLSSKAKLLATPSFRCPISQPVFTCLLIMAAVAVLGHSVSTTVPAEALIKFEARAGRDLSEAYSHCNSKDFLHLEVLLLNPLYEQSSLSLWGWMNCRKWDTCRVCVGFLDSCCAFGIRMSASSTCNICLTDAVQLEAIARMHHPVCVLLKRASPIAPGQSAIMSRASQDGV